AVPEFPEPAFRTHSLLLTGLIGVNFFMDLPAIDGVDYADSYMKFTVSGKGGRTTTDPYDPDDRNEDGSYYSFTCYVTSIQMADTITAEFHYFENGAEKTKAQTYSVARYVEEFEKVRDSYDELTAAAVHSLADYGHYVKPALAAENKWILGTDYAVMNKSRMSDYSIGEANKITKAVEKYAIVCDKSGSGIRSVSYRLRLDSSTKISVFLKPEAGYEGQLTAYLDGGTKNAAVLQSDGRYCIQISDIPAHELGKAHTVRVIADKEFTVTLSALSYVQTILNSEKYEDDTDLIYAMLSLYNYYDAIRNYNDR
ncbi:MAG: hypothetical protein IKN57_14485, partial [Parasporobacterium sp.]|nr:hypothetical protein [Parasporobacterium sp.]